MDQAPNVKTIIADDVEITGSIKCASSLRIDGRLNGDVTCTSALVVGETAIVKGNLSVESVTVHGQVNGNITAKDRIELKATAKLLGDISSKRLRVEDGVTFIGKAEVNPGGAGKPATIEPRPVEAPATVAESDGESRGKGLFGTKR